MIQFLLNDRVIRTEAKSAERLLDFLRLDQNLKGTREGCREGDCGACLVLVGEFRETLRYQAMNSCLLPLAEVEGRHVVTIEGLNKEKLNLIQKFIFDQHASQCGFCTPGIIMSMMGYLLSAEKLDAREALRYLDGNICRCTGYGAVKRASDMVVEKLKENNLPPVGEKRLQYFIAHDLLPQYFEQIPYLLKGFVTVESPEEIFKTAALRVAGATDLYVQHEDEMDDAQIVFLNQHLDWNKIDIWKDDIQIGGLATVEQIYRSPELKELLPEIDKKFHLISSTPIRNKATLAGNLVNASPIGDLSIFFLALDAQISLLGEREERVIPLRKFFREYKKMDLAADELIQWLRFPKPEKGIFFNFEKVSKREHLDIASVNSALQLQVHKNTIREFHLSAGGIAPIPFYFEKTRAMALELEISVKNIQKIVKSALEEIQPISDVRGSAAYKSLQLRQLIYAHFSTFFPKLLKKGDLI